jgi:general secretion pathway protein A
MLVEQDPFDMMYTEYFGLRENPFSIAPNPAYFYISEKHREALAHLMYAFDGEGGFVLLTGEVGTGKTTVCRRLLEKAPANCEIAFVLYPKLTGEELFASICDEFGIDYPAGTASSKVLVGRIYDYLAKTHEQGRRAILIIEEAQNLTEDVLEQIRLLTNLETNQRKLLQIIMLGQPELQGKLRQPQLSQLSQRITARYHLTPLSREDISGYVNHRLAVAGLPRGRLFPPSVLKELFHLTRGVPRLINVICDRALMGTYSQGKDRVDRKTLLTAAREVSGDRTSERFRRKALAISLCCLLVLCCGFAAVYYGRTLGRPAAAVSAKPQAYRDSPVASPKEVSDVVRVPTTAPLGQFDVSATERGLLTKERAFRALLKLWQVNSKVHSIQQTCTRIGGQGFGCLEGRETLEALRQMNRPAILRFSDGGDNAYYVLLTSFTRQAPVLMTGDKTMAISVEELGRRWSGDYLLLWRFPPGFQEELKRGDRGPFVSWVAKQLAITEGRAGNPASDQTYSDEMMRQVRQFQITAGLIPDGMVGPKTLIRLSDVGGRSEPSLDGGQGGR